MNYLSSRLPPEAWADCCKISCLPPKPPQAPPSLSGKTVVFRDTPPRLLTQPRRRSLKKNKKSELDFKTFSIQPRFLCADCCFEGFVIWKKVPTNFHRLFVLHQGNDETKNAVHHQHRWIAHASDCNSLCLCLWNSLMSSEVLHTTRCTSNEQHENVKCSVDHYSVVDFANTNLNKFTTIWTEGKNCLVLL